MSCLGSDSEGTVDLVQEVNIVLGEFVGRGQTGKERTRSVRSTDAKARNATPVESVDSVSTHLQAGGKSEAGRSADLRHIHHIQDTSGIKGALGVVDSEICSLVRLEGKLDIGGELQRSLQDTATISLKLSLVDIELGIGELGANLGGESASFSLLGLNCDDNRTGSLLALEAYLGGIVLSQDV